MDITVAMLNEYGIDIAKDCWFYAFNGRIIRCLKKRYGARTMGYPDFQMAEFDGYDAYDEIGLAMNLVRSELLELYASKGLPSKKKNLVQDKVLMAPRTKFDQIQQDTILDIVHIANAIYCQARRYTNALALHIALLHTLPRAAN